MSVPTRVDRPALGAVLTMLAMLGFACMDAISKWVVQDYAITQVLWVRYGLFAVFAVLLIGPRVARRAIHSNRPWLQAGRAVLAVVESGVFVLAFAYLPLAETHAVAATSPLIVIALSVTLLGERAGFARWMAVIAGFIGVLVIIRPGFQSLDWPILLPLLGAFLWGLYQILVRLCSRSDSSETTLIWSAFVGLAAMTTVGPWQWTDPDAMGWTCLIAVAVIGTLSHFALIKALSFAEAGAVQPFSYTLLVWATVLGLLVFGDVPDVWTIAGAGIIVLSGLYTWQRDRAEASRARAARGQHAIHTNQAVEPGRAPDARAAGKTPPDPLGSA